MKLFTLVCLLLLLGSIEYSCSGKRKKPETDGKNEFLAGIQKVYQPVKLKKTSFNIRLVDSLRNEKFTFFDFKVFIDGKTIDMSCDKSGIAAFEMRHNQDIYMVFENKLHFKKLFRFYTENPSHRADNFVQFEVNINDEGRQDFFIEAMIGKGEIVWKRVPEFSKKLIIKT